MAKRKGTGARRDRGRSQRGEAAGGSPQRASIREASDSKESDESRIGAAGKYSSVILTKEEMRRTIEAFATCLEHSALFPAKCDIVERARVGMYALHITVRLPQVKRSVSNLRLEATGNENS